MKKFVFGILIIVIGLIFSAFIFMYAIMNPGRYNGISGLYGSLLCADLVASFIILLIVLIVGIAICGVEAYRKKWALNSIRDCLPL